MKIQTIKKLYIYIYIHSIKLFKLAEKVFDTLFIMSELNLFHHILVYHLYVMITYHAAFSEKLNPLQPPFET